MSVYVWHDGRSELLPFLRKLTVQHGSSVDHTGDMKMILRWCGDDRVLNKRKRQGTILNHSTYTNVLLDPHKLHSTLQFHGIIYAPTQQSVNHLLIQNNEQDYMIPVFQMDALTILRHKEGKSLSLKREDWGTTTLQEVVPEQKTGLLRKLERYAIRVVYCLGLDLACVYARIQRSGRAVITHIDVNPIQCDQVNELYAKAINEYGEELLRSESKHSAVFGMDPEFLLRNKYGKIVPASRYLREEGGVGYDSSTVFGRKETHPLAELRPDPSEDVTILINNLRRTMWIAAKQITDHSLQWIAGGMPVPGLPLGGHLHISGIKLHSRLIRALDNYLALPLIMIEDTSTKGRRKRYGRLGDVRRPSHGGFEYRTLPSWIVSPRVTKGVFALTRLIVLHADQLVDRPLDRMEVLIAYKEGDKQALVRIVGQLWSQLESTTSYNEHRLYLEPLKQWVMEQRIWNEQADFRTAWRIPPYE